MLMMLIMMIFYSCNSLFISLFIFYLYFSLSPSCGDMPTHSIVSHSFLIPSLRSCLKRISRSCVICQRAYAKPLAHSMGLLPSVRTTPAPPQLHPSLTRGWILLVRSCSVSVTRGSHPLSRRMQWCSCVW